jgi:hypothetical protein
VTEEISYARRSLASEGNNLAMSAMGSATGNSYMEQEKP